MKHLSQMDVYGYRGFHTRQTINFACPDGGLASGLTVLTGPNNAGKSSILELVRALGVGTPFEFGRAQRNAKRNRVEVDYRFTEEEPKTLKSDAAGTYVASWNPPGPPFPNLVYFIPASRDVEPFFGKSNLDRQGYSGEAAKMRAQRNQTPNLNGYLMTIAENRDLKKRFDKDVTKLLGFEVKWELDKIENDNYVFSISSSTGNHTSDGIGFGVLSVFYIVAGFMDNVESRIVCVDEPEVSLHPQVQRRVAEYIAEKANTTQVIVSTHSPYFTNPLWFTSGAELARCYVEDKTIKVGRLSADAKERIRRLTADLNNPHLLGLDAREIFFADGHRRVLVVEGQEDVVILRGLLEDDAIKANFELFGWGAGGAEKIEYVLTVLADLGISDIAVLVDGDKRTLYDRLKREFKKVTVGILPTPDIRDKPARGAQAAKDGVATSKGELKPEHRDEVVALIKKLAA